MTRGSRLKGIGSIFIFGLILSACGLMAYFIWATDVLGQEYIIVKYILTVFMALVVVGMPFLYMRQNLRGVMS